MKNPPESWAELLELLICLSSNCSTADFILYFPTEASLETSTQVTTPRHMMEKVWYMARCCLLDKKQITCMRWSALNIVKLRIFRIMRMDGLKGMAKTSCLWVLTMPKAWAGTVRTHRHTPFPGKTNQRRTEVNEKSKHSPDLQAIPKCSFRRKKTYQLFTSSF